MRRAISFAVVAAVVLAAPGAARPPQRAGLTAAAKPFTLTFGQATTVSGKLSGSSKAGQRVELAEDVFPYGDGYTRIATTNTAANGDYAFRQTPASNRNYRVSVANLTAFTGARVRMRVSLSVTDTTPRPGQRVRFSGFVAPRHDGRTLLIQRRTATGRFVTVRRTLLRAATIGDRSRYSTRLTIRRSGTYRARIRSDGDHLAGSSGLRTLTVS